MATQNGFIETSVRDLLYVIFRHKWKIVFVTLLIAFGVTTYTYVVQELYRSEAKIKVNQGRETLAVDPSVSGQSMALLTDHNSEVRSEMQILNSQELVAEVVDLIGNENVLMKPDESGSGGMKGVLRALRAPLRGVKAAVDNVLIGLDLKERLSERDLAIKQATERLHVDQEKGSAVILVSYEAPGAELAQNTLGTLLTKYMIRHIEVHSGQASPEFYASRADATRAKLTEQEQALENFRLEHKVVNLNSQKDALLEHINQLRSDSTALEAQAAGSAARLAKLQEALAKTNKVHQASVTIRNVNPVVDNLRQVLVVLENDAIEMAARYPEDHRPLVQLREQILNTKAAIDAQEKTRTETTTGVDSVYQDLTVAVAEEASQLESKRAALAKMQAPLEKAERELDDLAGLEVQMASLQRNIDLAADDYGRFREKVSQSTENILLDEAEASNIRVIQQPTKPFGPSFPDKPMNIGLGLLLGLFTGIFLAFALDYLDDSLNTPEKAARKLGVPVLVTVSNEEFKACT